MNRVETELKVKLKNCLETFLEFEFFLSQLNQTYRWNDKGFVREEINFIKNVLQKIDVLEFTNNDLKRIENYLDLFIKEISSLTGKQKKKSLTWKVEEKQLQ